MKFLAIQTVFTATYFYKFKFNLEFGISSKTCLWPITDTVTSANVNKKNIETIF